MLRFVRRIAASTAFAFLMLTGAATSAAAQETAPAPESATPRIEQNVIVLRTQPVQGQGTEGTSVPAPPPDVFWQGPGGAPFGGPTFTFVSSEMSFDKMVKGAPYSAEAVTESTRTLADGNRIVRKTTSNVYRDSEGRTRREQTLGTIGPFASAGEPAQTFFINDPVAGVNYVLDPRTRTARKMPLPQIWTPRALQPAGRQGEKVEGQVVLAPGGNSVVLAPGRTVPEVTGGARVMVYESREGGNAAPHPQAQTQRLARPEIVSLGKQTVEGVEAEGTRITVTIPAGEIGNERPIQIVTERWYSPELQVVVMTRNTDPMAGETVYRLTNINRNEPARTLFEVPADYKIQEVKGTPEIRFRTTTRPTNDE